MRDKEVIIPVDIEKEMKKSFLEYSMSVIVARALPDVRDGMKPVHRRIIYTMYENNLMPDGPYRKCADTVGAVLGKYHPHGDSSVYDALVRLAQPFSMRYPLVDGQGNFGSVDGDPPAAYRYTEAKLKKIALEMTADIKKETVPFVPNYDDRLKEPEVLPSRFPNLLCNGSIGIAVGMATNIPPHNLGEVIDGIKILIENPECTVSDLMQAIKGPDFPTYGIIMGKSGIRSAYATGRGKICLRSRCNIEKVHGRDAIVATEIPYMVNKARLVESIAGLAKDKRIEGIHTVRDESGRQGMRIVVELNKGINPEIVLNKLYQMTSLQDNVSVNMLAIVNGEPKCLTLKQCLENYLSFQMDVIRKRTEFDLNNALKRAHILQGFCLAIDHIDEVIAILRASSNVSEGKQKLIERFKDVDMTQLLSRANYDLSAYRSEQEKGITEEQAEAIVQMRLGQLTGLEREKTEKELYDLIMKITDYRGILSSDQRIKNIIIEELEEIRKKFGDERRTEIREVSGEVDIEDLIPNEETVVSFTNNGYIKRVPNDTYKIQNRGGIGIFGMKQREEDYLKKIYSFNSHDRILVISTLGRMYRMKCYEIPDGTKGSRGNNIVNFLKFGENEGIASILHAEDDIFDDKHYLAIITKRGKFKKTPLNEFKNVRKTGIIAVKLNEGDEIAACLITSGDDEIFVASRGGYAIKFSENDVREMSRSSHGVNAIKLREGDEVCSALVVEKGKDILTVTDKGFGRRSDPADYNIQNRGGYGKINYKIDEKRGNVASVIAVSNSDDILISTTNGVVIRIAASDVNSASRTAKGVTVMRMKDNSESIVTVTTLSHIEDEKTQETQSNEQENSNQENE